jgi:hypothetical protein
MNRNLSKSKLGIIDYSNFHDSVDVSVLEKTLENTILLLPILFNKSIDRYWHYCGTFFIKKIANNLVLKREAKREAKRKTFYSVSNHDKI